MKTIQLVLICIYGCKYPGCEHVQQEHSLPTADAKHTRWTADEVSLVRETLDEPLVDVALVLGRTYYAVARARVKVKRGILKT